MCFTLLTSSGDDVRGGVSKKPLVIGVRAQDTYIFLAIRLEGKRRKKKTRNFTRYNLFRWAVRARVHDRNRAAAV